VARDEDGAAARSVRGEQVDGVRGHEQEPTRIVADDAGHDLVGCQDIAWDVVGAAVELGLSQAEEERLAARAKSLLQQNAVVEPRPLKFTAAGVAPLTRWDARQETAACRLEKLESIPGGANTGGLSITAMPGGNCIASWRTKIVLLAGSYRLEGRARTQGVKALEASASSGAGLRMSGTTRTNKVEGTANWTELVHEFQIQAPMQEVELVAELRATAGQAVFDPASLRLVRVKK